MLKKPRLVQRCSIEKEKLGYDYMGSTEFESGRQSRSLKRIFERGICTEQTTIEIDGQELIVFMFAGEGFPFEEYKATLQALAEHKIRLKEWTFFDEACKARIEGEEWNRTNAWFDLNNDVLWTLDETRQQRLVPILKGIKEKWSKK